jgi:small subunit ribosomal protein S16
MLSIRLQRVGRRHDPSFRVVVTDSHNSTKSGRFLEIVGSHNPHLKRTELKAERIKEWIAKGAQVSDTMRNMLITKGIITGKKVNVLPKKTPIKKDEPVAEEAKSAEAAAAPAAEAAQEPALAEEQAAEAPAEEEKAAA